MQNGALTTAVKTQRVVNIGIWKMNFFASFSVFLTIQTCERENRGGNGDHQHQQRNKFIRHGDITQCLV